MNDDVSRFLCKRLQMRRKALGLPGRRVAEKLCVTTQSVSAIENGKCRLAMDTYLHMCALYDLDPGDFLNDAIADFEDDSSTYFFN